MKKKIIIWFFTGLILLTTIFFLVVAIESYRYDLDPKNGVDIFEGVVAFICALIGGFVVLYELDLFYTVYYLAIKPKTPFKTVLNLLANISYLLIFVYFPLSDAYMELRAYEITVFVLFMLYLILRIIYFIGIIFSNDVPMEDKL